MKFIKSAYKKLCAKTFHLLPAGMEAEYEWAQFFKAMLCAFLYSLCYFVSQAIWISNLYHYDQRLMTRVLNTELTMPDYCLFAPKFFIGFAVTALAMLFVAAYHYIYHFTGSKSIYTMRRLPDRLELARRCLTLPAVMAVMALAAGAILMLAYLGVYMLSVPKPCLAPGQLKKLIAYFFGGAIC